MSLSAEERNAVVTFRLEKAQRAYEQACGVAQHQYWETMANRLYYAAYNAVSALLIAYGYNAQTHSGVIHLFGLHFVKAGIFPPETGRLYHDLFTMRLTGDYDDTYGLTENDVIPYIKPVGELITQVSELAKQHLK
ncbi:MAG: HEPN domain-containing protein [Bacteroidaceae bacterium]|nr:HEPN domain-containing protein [Bacteroidaceae bacterium]